MNIAALSLPYAFTAFVRIRSEAWSPILGIEKLFEVLAQIVLVQRNTKQQIKRSAPSLPLPPLLSCCWDEALYQVIGVSGQVHPHHSSPFITAPRLSLLSHPCWTVRGMRH